MNRIIKPAAIAALLFTALTVVMTWPQAAYLATRVHDSDDSLLSVWRLSWIAHILPLRPWDVLNGNIFHPEPRTLAYTDAVLLQGLAGAPLIWAGVPNTAVYNLVLLASFALSGWAMWLYAFRKTGSMSGALLAGIVFAFVPFRFDHFHHLELQATVFLPLTLLWLEHALESGRRADWWWAAAAFVGQVFSGIYYAVFLATVMAIIVAVRLWAATSEQRAVSIRSAVVPLAAAVAIIAPYLAGYVLNRSTLGERNDRDIALYSATWFNYAATPPGNWLYGSWSEPLGQSERRLFPGLAALTLAGIGLVAMRRGRTALLTAAIAGTIISLGFNTPLYDPIRDVLLPYRGLRAPARASILVFFAIAGLAAVGWARLTAGRSRRVTAIGAVLVAGVMLAEYRTRLDAWWEVPAAPPAYARWLADQPRQVVLEFPFAQPERLDRIHDGVYMFTSTSHWQPLVNGYSGFFPASFLELAERARTFPDRASVDYLRARGIDLIVVHGGLLGPEPFGDVTAALLANPEVEAVAQFEEAMGPDMVFRIRR